MVEGLLQEDIILESSLSVLQGIDAACSQMLYSRFSMEDPLESYTVDVQG